MTLRFVSFLCLAAAAPCVMAQDRLGNATYSVVLQPDASVQVSSLTATPEVFHPEFCILFRADDPVYKDGPAPEIFTVIVPRWQTPQKVKTTDVFQAAPAVQLRAMRGELTNGRICWHFPDQAGFTFSAALSLPDDGEPQISYTLTPKTAGYYSVGYTGAPQLDPAALDALWLPPAWQEKRFPASSVMAAECLTAMPAAMFSHRGTTVGVVADPASLPYRMPHMKNSRCGVALRTPHGTARPMIFSPILGGAESLRSAASPVSFQFRLSVRAGNIYDSYRHLARQLFGMRDYRQNTLTSLNGTLDNMIAFAMDDTMARWNSDLRGCDYSTDVPDTVKVVSALHPLSIALITDREDVLRRRAIPMIEYLLSREKYLFTTDPKQSGQGASSKMLGPTAEVFEWSSLYQLSGKRSTVFQETARLRHDSPRALNQNVINTEGKFTDALALFRATGDAAHLTRARSIADAYLTEHVDAPQTTWPKHAEFFTDFTPRWMQLYELWEETREPRYREAALHGARMYTQYCAVSPKIPVGEITLNMTVYQRGTAKVPAWEVSNTGLTPEATNTHTMNPAVLLTHYAPLFLRLGASAGDDFLRDLGRSAIVGRYANYPGYDINEEFSNTYSKADYPTTAPARIHRYNQIYFNHIWPHIALLMDYLVTDAEVRSAGAIHFPSRFAQGYVYLQSKVYGDRPGKFFGDENVRLYLPRGLVTPGNVQLNYVAGYGNDQLYLAFTNQSEQAVSTTITLNPPLLPNKGSHTARVWQENKAAPPITVEAGKFPITVAAKGITAMAIHGITPKPALQDKAYANEARATGPASHHTTHHPQLQKISASIMCFGKTLSTAYIWLDAPPSTLSTATLRYRCADGPWQELADAKYPYEFSLPLDDAAQQLEYQIIGTLTDSGASITSQVQTLSR